MRTVIATKLLPATPRSGISACFFPDIKEQNQKELKPVFTNLPGFASKKSKNKGLVILVCWGLVLLFSTSAVLAQDATTRPFRMQAAAAFESVFNGNEKISGIVVEDFAQKPVAFATVILIDLTNGETVDGGITDQKGKFSIVGVANGEYKLTVSFRGYETKEINIITINNKEEINLDSIALKPGAEVLYEVSIPGEKAFAEDTPEINPAGKRE